MTNEEAIKWLRLDIDLTKFDPLTGEDAYLNDDARHVIEAQEMAIAALEQLEPCEDAVSREALRKAMYHRAFETDGDTMWQSGCWIRYRAVEQVIKESPSVTPKMRWIPWDSGRFPDDSGMYIVTAYDGTQERVTFAKYQKRLKRWELTGARAYWRVLACMPLPEPYTEESI